MISRISLGVEAVWPYAAARRDRGRANPQGRIDERREDERNALVKRMGILQVGSRDASSLTPPFRQHDLVALTALLIDLVA